MIRPVFDEITEITFNEAEDVLQCFRENNIPFIDLSKDAVREQIEQFLLDDPRINVIHYDHGGKDCWIGVDEKKCVDCENVNLLAGRVCYTNNCSSAKRLGVEAWKRGAIYWGYKNVYVFTTDALEEFKTFGNSGIKAHIKGCTWLESLNHTQVVVANELIDKLLAEGKVLAASCIHSNRDNLVCYTPDNPPGPEDTSCLLRKLALKLFGWPMGWMLPRSFTYGLGFFSSGLFGLGVLGHDFAHQVWQLKGTVLSVEGGYIGLALALFGLIGTGIMYFNNTWQKAKSQLKLKKT